MEEVTVSIEDQTAVVCRYLKDAHIVAHSSISASVMDTISARLDRPVHGDDPSETHNSPIIFIGPHFDRQAEGEHLLWYHSTNAGIDNLQLPSSVLLTRTVGNMGLRAAEYVLAWIFSETHNVLVHTHQHQEHLWTRRHADLLAGSLAIIYGTGRIGSPIAQRLRSIGVDVVGVALKPRPLEYFNKVVSRDDVATDVNNARWIINALPLTKLTREYFDDQFFSAVDGATFISVGRGASVKYSALARALNIGVVQSAILDVLPYEPLPADSPWWTLPRTTITSHSAAITTDDDIVSEFVRCWFLLTAGKVSDLAVDRIRGY